jgi:hypothetical protein
MVHGVQQIYIEKRDEGDPELCVVEVLEAQGPESACDPVHIYDLL